MSRYAELDESILARLRVKSQWWNGLHYDLERDFPALYYGRRDNWRLTDGRLKALRKRGLIQPTRVDGESRWELTP